MLIDSPSGLFCPAGGFHVDPWGASRTRPDYPRPWRSRTARQPGVSLRRRLASPARTPVRTGRCHRVAAVRTRDRARRRAGLVSSRRATSSGSAQIRIDGADGVWVVAGDYKRAADPTCAPFEPVTVRHVRHRVHFRPADLSLGSAREAIVSEIMEWWEENAAVRTGIGPLLLHARQGTTASSPSWRASPIGRSSSTGSCCR